MLEGRFGNTTGSPYVAARISFPRFRLRGTVSFLVDTGADGAILMPADSQKLGINFRSLRHQTESRGIGGLAREFGETAVLSFSDQRWIYHYRLTVGIAAPSKHNMSFPSLLGRDIFEAMARRHR